MRFMLPRRLLPWLFALTLLVGQTAAFAHAIGHLHKHDAGLPEPVCQVCVAQANLGSAAPATVSTLPAVSSRYAAAPADPLPLVTAGCPNHAQARAPPVPV
jgi:hypothetical protein